MEFVLTVIGATPRSHSAITPTIFKSPNDAMDYAIALIEKCRDCAEPEPRFIIEGSDDGEMTADEILIIGRLYSPRRHA